MTKHLIEGKVAGIVNERELAINIGNAHGVKEGMKFKVLADEPTEIRDPETDELLGMVDRDKVRVKAIEVYDKFSICRTYRTVLVGNIDLGTFYQAKRTVAETLRADEASYISPLPEEKSFVKKGDRVIEIIDEE
jgi:hypothetical protein